MLHSLADHQINWKLFLVSAIILIIIPNLSWLVILALLISLHQLFLLFSSINDRIPLRYIIGFFSCVQIFVGPALAYHGFDKYQYVAYRMQIPEYQYFSYSVPAVIAFITGLHLMVKNGEGEKIKVLQFEQFLSTFKMLPYILISLGLIADFAHKNQLPQLKYFLFIIGNLKFIGIFLLLFGKYKFSFIMIGIVLLITFLKALNESTFYDFFTWTIFFGVMYCIRFKPGYRKKFLLGLSFFLLVLFIQSEKYSYRNAIYYGKYHAGINTFFKVYLKSIKENNGFFSKRNLAPSISRINQGFILSYVINTIPSKIPFENGKEIIPILKSAFLPKFIYHPDKIKGKMDDFKKYTSNLEYLGANTYMALTPIGDAYINFGRIGGVFFMLLLGIFFNLVLKFLFLCTSRYTIILIFTPLVFYYAIRPDDSLELMIGQIVKSLAIVFPLLEIIRIKAESKKKI